MHSPYASPKGHALNLRWSKQGMPLPIPACKTVDGAPFLIPPMRGRARIVLSPTGNRNALEKRRAAACNASASPAPPCGPGHAGNADIHHCCINCYKPSALLHSATRRGCHFLCQHGLIHASWLGGGDVFKGITQETKPSGGSAASLIVGETDDICLATACPVPKAKRLL